MNYMTVKRKADGNLDIWNDFDRVFNSFFNTGSDAGEERAPVTNVQENENGLVMTVELPGFGKEDLEVKVEENLLTIKAGHHEVKKKKEKDLQRKERQDIRFERSFVLPQDIQADRIEADLKNGLLTLKLPRIEKPAPLSIKVKG